PVTVVDERLPGGWVLLDGLEWLGQQVSWQRRKLLVAQHGGVRVRGAPVNDEGSVVGGNHLVHVVLRLRGEDADPGSRIDPPGKDEIARGEGLPIVPGQPGPQTIARFHAAIR